MRVRRSDDRVLGMLARNQSETQTKVRFKVVEDIRIQVVVEESKRFNIKIEAKCIELIEFTVVIVDVVVLDRLNVT